MLNEEQEFERWLQACSDREFLSWIRAGSLSDTGEAPLEDEIEQYLGGRYVTGRSDATDILGNASPTGGRGSSPMPYHPAGVICNTKEERQDMNREDAYEELEPYVHGVWEIDSIDDTSDLSEIIEEEEEGSVLPQDVEEDEEEYYRKKVQEHIRGQRRYHPLYPEEDL